MEDIKDYYTLLVQDSSLAQGRKLYWKIHYPHIGDYDEAVVEEGRDEIRDNYHAVKIVRTGDRLRDIDEEVENLNSKLLHDRLVKAEKAVAEEARKSESEGKQKYTFCLECNALSVFVYQSKFSRGAISRKLGEIAAVLVQSVAGDSKVVHSSINCGIVRRDSFSCPGCQDFYAKEGEDVYKNGDELWCHEECFGEAHYQYEEDPQYDHPGETPDLWDTHPEQMRLRQEVKE